MAVKLILVVSVFVKEVGKVVCGFLVCEFSVVCGFSVVE